MAGKVKFEMRIKELVPEGIPPHAPRRSTNTGYFGCALPPELLKIEARALLGLICAHRALPSAVSSPPRGSCTWAGGLSNYPLKRKRLPRSGQQLAHSAMQPHHT
jgi:hypothetical protein